MSQDRVRNQNSCINKRLVCSAEVIVKHALIGCDIRQGTRVQQVTSRRACGGVHVEGQGLPWHDSFIFQVTLEGFRYGIYVSHILSQLHIGGRRFGESLVRLRSETISLRVLEGESATEAHPFICFHQGPAARSGLLQFSLRKVQHA